MFQKNFLEFKIQLPLDGLNASTFVAVIINLNNVKPFAFRYFVSLQKRLRIFAKISICWFSLVPRFADEFAQLFSSSSAGGLKKKSARVTSGGGKFLLPKKRLSKSFGK